MLKNTQDDKDLNQEIGQVTSSLKQTTIKSQPKFIVNPIIYVDGQESGESSDEEYNPSDEKRFDQLDCSNKETLLYRTYTKTKKWTKKIKKKQKVSKEEYSFSKPVGFVKVGSEKNKVLVKLESFNSKEDKKSEGAVQKFLKLLSDTGVEKDSEDKIEDTVSASMLLNRPLSLSSRKNNILTKELEYKAESAIAHKKSGVFWEFNCYTKGKTEVKYEDVRTFYKKLKKYDKDKNTTKAKQFLDLNEKNIAVPYQGLRELAKNHNNTKTLVKKFRDKDKDSDVYLSIVDGDTVSFNGIYSAYIRIHKNAKSPYTVMSTGYEFPKEENSSVHELGSQIDRMIRVSTTKHMPLGVYYPEPNTCVLLPKNKDTVPESFVNQSKKGNLESASLLRKVNLRENASFIFSDDNPVITTIPPRAKLNKSHKTLITFSQEFIQGASPSAKDITSLKNISQSHFHEKVWYDNLFINGAIKPTGKTEASCKSLLAKIRNCKDKEQKQAIKELKKYIDPNIVDLIVKAAKEVNKYVAQFEIDHVASENEAELLKLFKKFDVQIKDFSRDAMLVLSQEEVIELILKEIIDLNDLKDIDIKILEEMFYDEDNLEQFITAIENGYSTSEILTSYEDDSFHLRFMSSDDPTDIVLENSNDYDVIELGIKNYDIDVEWIISELAAEHEDGDSSALQYFQMVVNNIYPEPEKYNVYQEDYEYHSGQDSSDEITALMGELDLE